MIKFAVLLLVLSLVTNFTVAQKNNESARFNTNSAKSLIMALNTDNEGLKRSAVYFAGYYKIDEAVESLSDILNSNENDIKTKTLAAYSLYQIGDDECMDVLKDASKYCSDKKLCSKCRMMYEDLRIKSRVVYQ